MNRIIRSFSKIFRLTLCDDLTLNRCNRMSDEELMIEYGKKGDAKAFEELLNRYRSQVFGYFVSACRHRETAEDLFQETFFRIIRSARSYKPKSSFRTWVFTIARNILIDWSRKSKKGAHAVNLNDNSGKLKAHLEPVSMQDNPEQDIQTISDFLAEIDED